MNKQFIPAYRAELESRPVAEGRTFLLRFLRKLARWKVYRHAHRQHIVDYADTTLVEQTHRDFRDSVITAAQTKVADAQTATTTAELLVIFDSIVQWIE